MDHYIIRDTKHFLFWENANKKDKTILEDITIILKNRIEILQNKALYNVDVNRNIDLQKQKNKLETILTRLEDKMLTLNELFLDMDEMFCSDKLDIDM